MEQHEDGRTGDGAEDWDARYADGGQQLWSGRPNGGLVDEAGELVPGTALDVGCGEGADAIWLAQRGWRVTAVDISEVAIERARRAAAAAGADVEWLVADVTAEPLDRRFDLVSLQYPALRHDPDGATIRALLGAVAPGGTLLHVGHDLTGHEHHTGFDPADYVQPGDVASQLDASWSVDVHEVRRRTPPPGHRGPDVPDVVLRARRIR
ncbi:MAG TPA: class I SAM-dependent methyltransferase [Acidimicrobiales bacterium]|nr:class I SAM-dependent methyltransferase [Acidimicrobiales bacterium]